MDASSINVFKSRLIYIIVVKKNIDVRIKNIKKHVLYPIIKNMKKTFVKNISPTRHSQNRL